METLKAIINQYNMYFVMLHHVHIRPDPILIIVSSFVHMSVHYTLRFAKFQHKKPFKIVLIKLKDTTCTCYSKTVPICNIWFSYAVTKQLGFFAFRTVSLERKSGFNRVSSFESPFLLTFTKLCLYSCGWDCFF